MSDHTHHPGVVSFEGHTPTIGPGVFIAPGAHVIGQVTLAQDANIWHNCVIRGDDMPITIGERTNIQDLSMIHVTTGMFGCHIGADVTVGHRAIIHACTIGDRCLIGMGAIILDGAVIEDDCMIAAGSIIGPGKRIESGSMMMGAPGRFKRLLTEQDIQMHILSALHYVETAQRHAKALEQT